MSSKAQSQGDSFNPKNWLQVVYGVPVFAVVPIVSYLKPETAIYSTIIALSIIALLFFIVKRTAFSKVENGMSLYLEGTKDGLQQFLKNTNDRIKGTEAARERAFLTRMAQEIESRAKHADDTWAKIKNV